MVLKEIVNYKHEYVHKNEENFKNYATKVKPANRNFKKAILEANTAFILEIKPSSPSLGLIRKEIDLKSIAQGYALFANAISVLADEHYFGGSSENIKKVSSYVKIPILAKDIVVSALQIFQYRFFGADAILLMLSVLDDEIYKKCVSLAKSLNLSIITEVHTEEELKRALGLDAEIIGINNRNLHTLNIDLNVSERLLKKVPKSNMVILESGFSDYQQLTPFKGRVNGFLVGSSLMKEQRIDLATRALIFGRIKICGLTNKQDAKLSYEHGAYYGGLNFSSFSKRKIDLKLAKEIIDGAPLVYGGVFVNQSIEEITNVVSHLNLNFVQLHGDEDENYICALKKQLPESCQIWQAIRIVDDISKPFSKHAQKILLDSYCDKDFGGTGKSFNWDILRGLDTKNIILAGGLNENNIVKASSLGVFALDIASSVEENPRKKSEQKVKKIFSLLRGEYER